MVPLLPNITTMFGEIGAIYVMYSGREIFAKIRWLTGAFHLFAECLPP
jgi:hypothetical protein